MPRHLVMVASNLVAGLAQVVAATCSSRARATAAPSGAGAGVASGVMLRARWIARLGSHWPPTAASTTSAVELGGVTVLRADEAPAQPDGEPDRRARRRRACHRGRARRRARGDRRAMSRCYVAVAPEARPAELADWLRRPRPRARLGLDDVPARRRAAWPARSTSLRLVRVGAAEAQDFGRIVATGYGLPDAVVPWARTGTGSGLGLLARARRRRAGGGGRRFHRRGRRVPRLRRHPAGASGQGRPERAARGADRARPRGGLRRRRHRDRRAPRRAFPRTRTATSSAPGSPRSRCTPTGSGRRRAC